MGKKNILVTIRPKETILSDCSFKARFLGIINSEYRRAVLNTKKAADRIATAASISPSKIDAANIPGKYLVLVTDEINEDRSRVVFITPKINYLRYSIKQKVLSCADNKDYVVEEIK